MPTLKMCQMSVVCTCRIQREPGIPIAPSFDSNVNLTLREGPHREPAKARGIHAQLSPLQLSTQSVIHPWALGGPEEQAATIVPSVTVLKTKHSCLSSNIPPSQSLSCCIATMTPHNRHFRGVNTAMVNASVSKLRTYLVLGNLLK